MYSAKMIDMEAYVQDKETDPCISRLRFLSQFYITVIQKKQDEMNRARSNFLADRDDRIAYALWTENKKKICRLYEYWLRELLQVDLVDEPHAICMHSMMTADCYWFLAKTNQPAYRTNVSNMEMACESMELALSIVSDSLSIENAFYKHLVNKYSLLVEDYKNCLSIESNPNKFRVPMHMFNRDVEKLKEAQLICRMYMGRISGNRNVWRKQQALSYPQKKSYRQESNSNRSSVISTASSPFNTSYGSYSTTSNTSFATSSVANLMKRFERIIF